MKQTILICFPSFERGGAEASLKNYIAALQGEYEILLLTSDSVLGENLGDHGTLVTYPTSKHRALNTLRSCIHIPFAIRRSKCDIILSFQGHLFTLMASYLFRWIASKRIFLVCRESNDVGVIARNKGSVFKRLIFEKIIKGVPYSIADLVVANSSESEVSIHKLGVPAEKTAIWYNPILHPRSKLSERLLTKRSNIERRDFDFCFVGRLSEQKNPLLFLDIVEFLYEANPSLKFAIAGDGDLMEEVQRKCRLMRAHEAISILGYVPAIPILLNSKYFLLTSRYEGSPNILVEALVAGCICIVNDGIAGCSEILNGQRFGMSIDMADPAKVASYLLQCTPIEKDWNDRELSVHLEMFDGRSVIDGLRGLK